MKLTQFVSVLTIAGSISALNISDLATEFGVRAINTVEQNKQTPPSSQNQQQVNASFTDDMINKAKDKMANKAKKLAIDQATKPSVIIDQIFQAAEPYLLKVLAKSNNDPEVKKVLNKRINKLLDQVNSNTPIQPTKSKRSSLINLIKQI